LIHRANINAQNEEGVTALMFAVGSEKTSIVKELLDTGADVYIKDRRGESALNIAQDKKLKAISNLLKVRTFS
jgi:uncharacterized protein